MNKIIFLPLLLSIIILLNWVAEMATYLKRGLVLLTLGTILWSIYDLLKEPVLPGRILLIVFLVAGASALLVLVTLLKTGW